MTHWIAHVIHWLMLLNNAEVMNFRQGTGAGAVWIIYFDADVIIKVSWYVHMSSYVPEPAMNNTPISLYFVSGLVNRELTSAIYNLAIVFCYECKIRARI